MYREFSNNIIYLLLLGLHRKIFTSFVSVCGGWFLLFEVGLGMFSLNVEA